MKVINKAGDKFYYFYDPTASIPAVVYEQGPATGGRPGAGNRYVNIREPDGSLLRRDRYVEDQGTLALDQTRTYHFDGLGSTIELTDESGVITDKFSCDAWGDVTRVSGSTNDNPYLYVGRLGYYTHFQEPSMNPLDQTSGTKLLQLGVRYYDPEIGRFTQRDPIRDGLNWYAYVECNPLRYVDPSGRFWKIIYDGECARKKAAIATPKAVQFRDKHRPGESTHNTITDAVRHCLWACYTYKDCGRITCWLATTGHEWWDNEFYKVLIEGTDPQSRAEYNMDMHNNVQGAACGRERKKTCYDCCTDKALKNPPDLVWIDGSGGTTPPEYD